jgi:hypothetical protein
LPKKDRHPTHEPTQAHEISLHRREPANGDRYGEVWPGADRLPPHRADVAGIITGITYRPNGIVYLVMFTDCSNESICFDIEIVAEKNFKAP